MKNMSTVISIVGGLYLLLSCSHHQPTLQTSVNSDDSVKNLILSKEKETLDRWYHGDPMGFADNSWKDITYFDPSLKTRIDSLDAFRKLLTPLIGQIHIPWHRMDKPLIRVFGDIAVLSFTDVFAIDKDTARWHATEIYLHREKDWKLIHSHWTESKVK